MICYPNVVPSRSSSDSTKSNCTEPFIESFDEVELYRDEEDVLAKLYLIKFYSLFTP
jgi:hypothetical protein